jgi:transcriptional regulator with XRE-family HTH domain
MPTPVGQTLTAARKDRGWSLRDVEGLTGIQNAHLSQCETGAIARPGPGVLWTLAEIYGLDFDELMGLAGHVQQGGQRSPTVLGAAVVWRALTALTPGEQRQALEFMRELRRRRVTDPEGGPG